MAAPQWRFDGFRLDPVNARLWRGAEPLALPPKVFNVLHYLVTHPDRLVTKDELLAARRRSRAGAGGGAVHSRGHCG